MARALSDSELAKLRSRNALLWCRLSGFQGYPARFCTEHEEEQLQKLQKSNSSRPQCAVVFLGLKPQQAWVNESAVLPFQIEPAFLGPSSQGEYNYNAARKLDFDEIKFRRNKDYRCAVIEASMIQVFRESNNSRDAYNDLFPDAEMTALIKSDIMPRLKQPQDECCICSGTTLSGTVLTCSTCQARVIHMHCLGDCGKQTEKETDMDVVTWRCSVCCPSEDMTGTVTFIENSAAAGMGLSPKADKADGKKRRKSGGDSLQEAKAAPSASSNLSSSGVVGTGAWAGGGAGGAGKSGDDGNAAKRPRNGAVTASTTSAAVAAAAASAARAYGAEQQAITALDPALLAFASSGGSSFNKPTSALGPESGASEADEEGSTDDYCHVCDEGGTLLLCDFPGCRKVYHQGE